MKLAAIVSSVALVIVLVLAMQVNSAGLDKEKSGPEEAYVPGLGDFMISIQMRHMKLWFAGSAGNWELAAYELGEIREGFGDAARFNPVFKGIPVADLIEKVASKPLKDIGSAIKAKDISGFKTSFDGLTAACNECHRAAQHGIIVIRRPEASPFSDQVFEVKPR